jgi:hypothetical protein
MARRKKKRGYKAGTIIPPRTPGGTWAIRLPGKGNKKGEYFGGFESEEMARKVLTARAPRMRAAGRST